MTMNVPKPLEDQIDELITHYPEKRSAALMVLHALQDHLGYLPKAAMEWAAAKLEVQPIQIYELVTFYPMFRQQPVGKHVIRVCRTLSCALAGSAKVYRHFCEKLGLNPFGHGIQTTPDGKFSVEFVECLASCGTAPVIMCNEDFYEAVSTDQADRIMAQCG